MSDEQNKIPNKKTYIVDKKNFNNIVDIGDFEEKIEMYENNSSKSLISEEILVDDYYLTSFCFTEYIPGNITYRCVFVKINYDDNFNVISKVRYDDKEMEYEQNKYQFMDNELKIFNQIGINEYYDDNNKYHINMLCYVKKNS